MQKILLILLLLVGLPIQQALASNCSAATASTTISPPNITIQRDTPVGSVIGSEVVSGVVNTFTCDNASPPLTLQEFGVAGFAGNYANLMLDGRRIYNTGIPGVGYAIGITTPVVCPGTTVYVTGDNTIDGNNDNRLACSVNGAFGGQFLTAIARLTYYKTAAVTGVGTAPAQKVGDFILRNNSSLWIIPDSEIRTNPFTVTALACTVNNQTLNVPMGNVPNTSFSGVGSNPEAKYTKSFSIPLTCDAGTKVNLNLSGTVLNASEGVLALDGGTGSATGVGVQVLFNNAPLALSTTTNVGTVPAAGAYNIPLQARYYKSAAITPGTANATATFTLTYQ